MPDASSAGPPERVGTARLIQAHGLRPDKDFGQNFLLDENLCDVAVRDARVGHDDVVLEVGPGVGTLTAAIARQAAHVHAVEIDRRLEPALAESLGAFTNVQIHWGDVMKLDLTALDPAPTRLVANLPYNIATPIVMESLWKLPQVGVWAVMVQREVADRWVAPVGSALYGSPTVLLAMCTRQLFLRPVPPTVFMPRPHVDSAIVGLERTGSAPSAHVRAVVVGAFGQRRKTLLNAVSAAGWDKAQVAAALEQSGLAPTARAQELGPDQFIAFAGALDA